MTTKVSDCWYNHRVIGQVQTYLKICFSVCNTNSSYAFWWGGGVLIFDTMAECNVKIAQAYYYQIEIGVLGQGQIYYKVVTGFVCEGS